MEQPNGTSFIGLHLSVRYLRHSIDSSQSDSNDQRVYLEKTETLLQISYRDTQRLGFFISISGYCKLISQWHLLDTSYTHTITYVGGVGCI